MTRMSPEPSRDDDRRGIERELKRGSLELIVLHLLSLGEAYGYEIVTALGDIRYTGYVTTEVSGGDAAYLKDVGARVDRFLAGQKPVG